MSAAAKLRAILSEYLADHLASDAEVRLTDPPGHSVYTDGSGGRAFVAPQSISLARLTISNDRRKNCFLYE